MKEKFRGAVPRNTIFSNKTFHLTNFVITHSNLQRGSPGFSRICHKCKVRGKEASRFTGMFEGIF